MWRVNASNCCMRSTIRAAEATAKARRCGNGQRHQTVPSLDLQHLGIFLRAGQPPHRVGQVDSPQTCPGMGENLQDSVEHPPWNGPWWSSEPPAAPMVCCSGPLWQQHRAGGRARWWHPRWLSRYWRRRGRYGAAAGLLAHAGALAERGQCGVFAGLWAAGMVACVHSRRCAIGHRNPMGRGHAQCGRGSGHAGGDHTAEPACVPGHCGVGRLDWRPPGQHAEMDVCAGRRVGQTAKLGPLPSAGRVGWGLAAQ